MLMPAKVQQCSLKTSLLFYFEGVAPVKIIIKGAPSIESAPVVFDVFSSTLLDIFLSVLDIKSLGVV